jgi:hypothetical protein
MTHRGDGSLRRQGVGLARRIQPAGEIVREVAEEAARVLERTRVMGVRRRASAIDRRRQDGKTARRVGGRKSEVVRADS